MVFLPFWTYKAHNLGKTIIEASTVFPFAVFDPEYTVESVKWSRVFMTLVDFFILQAFELRSVFFFQLSQRTYSSALHSIVIC